jgi:glutamyl-tRNA synthetase
MDIRVRFAPSPTGHLHIGGARTAIFNWLFARHNGGKFLVRIEDTDVQRSKKEYVDSILESLEWLQITPDEPILYQMSRIKEHQKAVNVLLENGLAYPCFCEPKDAGQTVQNLERGIVQKYDSYCRNKKYTLEDLKKPHAIRFKLPDQRSITFNDLIRGEVTVELDQLDDFVIMRRDKTPTYNFVVVIDDIYMKITHIIRGEDHLSNTHKQILIYQALGEATPKFAHLPLILSPSGGKLSKRDAAVSVVEYKKLGTLPDALINYLVRLGWSHGDQEIFSKQEMIDFFSIEKVGKKGAIFDTKKLFWLNGVYIRKLKYGGFASALSDVNNDKLKTLTKCFEGATVGHAFELYRERATSVVELAGDLIAFANGPSELNVSLIEKWLSSQTKTVLELFLSRVKEMKEVIHETLITLAKNICKEHEIKLVALAQPLRLALTGKIRSPGVFELIELLGFEEVETRVKKLIEILG